MAGDIGISWKGTISGVCHLLSRKSATSMWSEIYFPNSMLLKSTSLILDFVVRSKANVGRVVDIITMILLRGKFRHYLLVFLSSLRIYRALAEWDIPKV